MTQYPALPPGATERAPGPPYGLPTARKVILYLTAAGVVLWIFSGFTFWVFAVGLGGILIARLVVGLFPTSVRRWMGPFVLACTFLFLATRVSPWALGITAGLLGIGAAVELRHWHRWPIVLGVALAVLIGCTVGYALEAQAQERFEQQDRERTHEHNVAELRPREPQRVMSTLMHAIATNRPQVACFQFSDGARNQFVASVPDAADCNDAVQRLSARVKNKNQYSQPNWEDGALSRRGEEATLDACSVTWGDTFSGRLEDQGPKVGKLTLARQARTGWIITNYDPCQTTRPR